MRGNGFTLTDLACILVIVSVSVSLTAPLFTGEARSFSMVPTSKVTAEPSSSDDRHPN